MSPHHHHTREEIAKIEIGHTDSTRPINLFLTLLFLALITVVPVLQTVVDWKALARDRERAMAAQQPGPARRFPQVFDVMTLLMPSGAEWKGLVRSASLRQAFRAGRAINNRMLADIGAYERTLKDGDRMIQALIPMVQSVLTGLLRGGNEDVYCGRGGWLFYRRDIDCLTGRGFLDPAVLKARAAGGNELKAPPQPDPVRAIVEFDAALKARGIRLIVMPVPSKAGVEPDRFSRRYGRISRPLQNPSFEDFAARLKESGVLMFDCGGLLVDRKNQAGTPSFLVTDTHWRPEAMEAVADGLGDLLDTLTLLPAVESPGYRRVEEAVTNRGDLAVMLRLPGREVRKQNEAVRIHPVVNARGEFWSSTPSSDVLLLGDSFSNIFSLDAMGWGAGAGFAEQLSFRLRRPVDRIVRNDAGAFATREMLAREMAQGRDRLAGKKVVIWEFAIRELSVGDWKSLPLKTVAEMEAIRSRTAGESVFLAVPAGQSIRVSGTIQALSPVPRPGSVPYKDHILTVHLTGLEGLEEPVDAREAVVYLWSMRDNKLLPAARCRPGDRLNLTLKSWSDVAEQYGSFNRSELEDEDLQLQTPNWGGEWNP